MSFQNLDTNPLSEKEMYHPIKIIDVDPEVTALQKTSEEKLYIVLYYNIEYEEYRFAKFIGRYNTYFGIRDLLESQSIDLHASEVLVEIVGIDPKTKKARRYLLHPDNASDIFDFCKQMEKFFGDNAYSIESYDTGYTIKEVAEYITDHDEPTPIDYKRVNEMLNPSKEAKPMDQEELEEAYGIGKNIFGKNGAQPFISQQEASELGKQFFTPANMGDIEGKEI